MSRSSPSVIMEVGNGQFHENFPSGIQSNDFEDDDDDDDDGHFVIALDDSDVENDELDGGTLDLTKNTDYVNAQYKGDEVDNETVTLGFNEVIKDAASTLREPSSKALAHNLKESYPLSLRLECTTEDVERQFQFNSTNGSALNNDASSKEPELPNFLTASPDIIKRLEATLLDRTSTSLPSSDSNKAPSVLDCHSQVNSDSSHSPLKSSETQRKLAFTPRTDCSCIMCHGWDPSKVLATNSPTSNSSDQLPKGLDIHQKLPSEPVVSNRCGMSSNKSHSVISSSNKSHSVISNPVQKQTYLKPDMCYILPDSGSSDEKLKLDQDSSKRKVADDTRPSPRLLNSNNHNIAQKIMNPVVEINGSFILLIPQPSLSSKKRVAYVKKTFPEISTKEGKVLILTHDFMNEYQPDLRAIIARSKKMDLSVPGTVCILMRDGADKTSFGNATHSKNSDYVLKVPTSQLTQQYSTALSTNLIQGGVNDALLKVVYSHLFINSKANASNLLKTINSLHTTKQIPASQTSEVTGKSQLSPPQSSPSIEGSKTLPQLFVSSASIDQCKMTFSSLPPPPPLVRRPSVPTTRQTTCSSTQLLLCSSATYAPFSVCITTTTSSTPQYSTKTSYNPVLSLDGTIISPSVTSNSVSECPNIENRTEFMPFKESSPADKQSGHTDAGEPREILVIPVVSKEDLRCREDQISLLNTHGRKNSAGLYTFTAPLEKSQEDTLCQYQEQTEVENDNLVSCKEAMHFEPTPSLYGQSAIYETPPEYQKSSSFTDFTNTCPVVSTSLANKIAIDPNLKAITNQRLCNDSAFPSVVKINLSSCANMDIVYSGNQSHVASSLASSSDSINDSTITVDSNSYIQEAPQNNPILSHLLSQCSSVGTCPSQSYQMYTLANSPVSSKLPFSQSQSIKGKYNNSTAINTQTSVSTTSDSTVIPRAAFFPSSGFVPVTCSLNTDYVSQSSILSTSNCVDSISSSSSSSSSQTARHVSTMSSSSLFTSSLQSTFASKTTPIFSSSLLSSSLHSALSSSTTLTSSSSSVSVNGLKMKIRLGDAKNNCEVGETKSENGFNNSKAHPVKRKPSCDQGESLEEKTVGQRKESAEEMFQRYQEQAMRDVYNAQFGVGNLSRSLRPSRSNISFVDKSFHSFRADDSKKKKAEEDKPKSTEEIKKNRSSDESQLKGSETDNKRTIKVPKKRHSSNESRSDVKSKSPEYDINDFPKLREDTSILTNKTIHTPNIMAGHKVFVKFNVFSNPQSCRSFLIPFFNLGGSRVQFDNEDMDYIKRAVVEVEKEERFCARHLIYYSREGSKASFLRKENLAQTNDIKDESYQKCSYILEGFSRDSVKKSEPLPEEWKVDKKVSIEIDTAEVDSNVVIDFEESLSDAVVSSMKEQDVSQKTQNIHMKLEGLNGIVNSGTDQTKVDTGSCIYSASQDRQVACKNVSVVANSLPKSCLSDYHSNKNPMDASSLNNLTNIDQKDIDDETPLSNKSQFASDDCDLGCGKDSSHNSNSTTFRPNILRKKSTIFNSKSHNLHTQPAGLLPSKTLSQNSTSEVNYTDQLKELFSSGNFHETFVYTGKENKEKEQCNDYLTGAGKEQDLLPPLKKEIIDEEYSHSALSCLDSDVNPSLLRKANTLPLSSANLRVKSEPVDEYFESLEGSRTNAAASVILDKRMSNSLSSNEQSVSHVEPMDTVNVNAKMNIDQEARINKIKLERDDEEETLSTFSDSVPLSSNVSESSEISSSSCTDTSDEDISGDNEDCSPQSVTSLSCTSNVSESPVLLNANFSQNSCSTKITSLVESLKQRLSQNIQMDLPPVVPSSSRKSKMKRKKKKRKLTSLSSIKTQSMDSDILKTANTDIVHTKCSSSSLIQADTSSLHSVSKAPKNSVNLTSISSQSTLLSPMPPKTNVTDSHHLSEFRKRFAFITHQDKYTHSNCDTMHNLHQEKEPGNTLDEPRVNNETQDKDSLNMSISSIPITCRGENNDSTQKMPCDGMGSDSESDIDVGSEDAVLIDFEASNSKSFSSSSLFPDSKSSNNKDLTMQNEFSSAKSMDMQDTVNLDIPSKKFSLPLRPRNKTRTTKIKSSTAKIAYPPSTASLLCQKLDIPVEPIVPKLKGKLVLPFQTESRFENKDTLPIHTIPQVNPKPINPGFKPSINAIFGVTEIPKTLDTVMNKTSSSKASVAKKSSAKKSKGQMTRQVAKKGTSGNIKNKGNIKQQDCVVLIENRVQPENKSVVQESKGEKQGRFKKHVVKNNFGRKFTLSNDKRSSLKTQVTNNKKVLLETKSNPNPTQKKSNSTKSNKKSCMANRKLGSLLVEVNRYSSLRKFAWRKYSGFREKTYIVETDGNDSPAIVDSDGFILVENHSDSKFSSFDTIKQNTVAKEETNLNIKPCKLILHKLEDMKWDSNSNEIPIKTASGSFIIKHVQDQENHNKVSEVMKKRKKKSVFRNHKKNSGKPKNKRDIVDYYAAAIESLRKKALLLEENEKKKMETEPQDKLVVKQEVIESIDFTGNEKKIEEEKVDLTRECLANISDTKPAESFVINKCENDLLSQEILSNNGGNPCLDSNEIIASLGNGLDVTTCNPLVSDQKGLDVPTKNTKLIEIEGRNPSFEAENGLLQLQDVKPDHRNGVRVVERNYEGEMIQVSSICFQDQNDIEGMSSDEDFVESNVHTNEVDDEESYVQDAVSISPDKNEKPEEEANLLQSTGEKTIDIIEDSDQNVNYEEIRSNIQNFEKHCTIQSISLKCESVMTSSSRNNPTELTNKNAKQLEYACFKDEIVTDIFDPQDKGMGYGGNSNKGKPIAKSPSSTISLESEKLLISTSESLTADSNQNCEVGFEECTRTFLNDNETNPSDCNFVHKDIILGFEDSLGADTVLSTLVADEEEDMFLLDDGDNDAENIGLIPDEEVERLLGLDVKDSESETPVAKPNVDSIKQGVDGINRDTLSWKLLPENSVHVDDIEKVEAKSNELETRKLHGLIIDTCSGVDKDTIPESENSKPAKVSPSWKRILGTQALKEIEESVSSAIATANVEKDISNHSREKQSVPSLCADKFKLKLCTGALSKAFKLSAEMRKTYGDGNDSNFPTESGSHKKATNVNLEKHKVDGGSPVGFAQSILDASTVTINTEHSIKKSFKGLRRMTSNCSGTDMTHTSGHLESGTELLPNTQNNKCMPRSGASEDVNIARKPFANTKIDLTKLKMKLTPILAATKAKSNENKIASKGEESNRKQVSSFPHTIPEVKESTPNCGMMPFKLETDCRSSTTNIQKTKPLLNTEKLAKILKNFKKPTNFDTFMTKPLLSNLSKPSSRNAINNLHPKAQNVSEQKFTNRKRRQHFNSADDKTTESKKLKSPKTDELDILKEKLEIDEDKGQRSCFDCLSALTPSE